MPSRRLPEVRTGTADVPGAWEVLTSVSKANSVAGAEDGMAAVGDGVGHSRTHHIILSRVTELFD
jgi:hypothetical protein